MSVESARELLAKALEDPGLLQRLAGPSPKDRQAFARIAGFQFTKEELRQRATSLPKPVGATRVPRAGWRDGFFPSPAPRSSTAWSIPGRRERATLASTTANGEEVGAGVQRICARVPVTGPRGQGAP